MRESTAVCDGVRQFYAAFSSHDPETFASAIAECPGISVIGSAPEEGHDDRDAWISTYERFVPTVGLRLEGGDEIRGWEEGSVGFAVDRPRFVMTDGSFVPTRLTGVLRREDGDWKVVHLHFSVGVADEDAVQPPR
jgi:ketosteroid isomerase-like protein